MDVVYERCAGIDISKADVKVCVRTPGAGKGKRRHEEVRTFPALTSGLLAMRDWLLAEGVTVVGMEATGSPVVTIDTFRAPYAGESLTAALPGSSPLPWPSPRFRGARLSPLPPRETAE